MERIRKLWRKVPNVGKTISILALVAAMALPLSRCGASTGKAVYLVDLEDKYQHEAVLTDEEGKLMTIDSEDVDQLIAIVGTEKTKKGKDYQVVLINEDGEYTRGYMDGKYLDDDAIDSKKVKHDLFSETSVVIPEAGLWLRDNDEKVIDHYTEDAYLLPQGVNVMTSKVYETSKDNSYKWKEAVYYNREDNTLERGYLVGDYVYSTDYNQIQGKKFKVANTNGISLKLRKGASLDAEKIGSFPEGTEVTLIPSIASISDGTYDWFYVAVKTPNGVVSGYMAATYYNGDETIHYLEESKKNEVDAGTHATGKMIMKVVDTSSVGYVPLKLRKTPGLKGEILSELGNDTVVYTYELLDKHSNDNIVDGYSWLQVYLTNGDTGYVATKYLKNKTVSQTNDLSEYVDEINLGSEGTVEGYYGVDVKNTTDYNAFEKLITGKIDFNGNYSVKRDLSAMDKPQFVMFKIGGSYTSRSHEQVQLVDNAYSQLDNLKKLTSLCEKYEIPYGFYFYSQATSNKDVEIETDFIKYALSEVGGSTYNILPVVYDVEEHIWHNGQNIPTRAKVYADKYGRKAMTDIANKWMNKVREENGVDVTVYAAHSCFTNMLKYSELDDKNQQDVWAVSPSSAHSNALTSRHPDVVDNISMRQIALDAATVQGINWDVNFINKDYLEGLLKEHGLLNTRGLNH